MRIQCDDDKNKNYDEISLFFSAAELTKTINISNSHFFLSLSHHFSLIFKTNHNNNNENSIFIANFNKSN